MTKDADTSGYRETAGISTSSWRISQCV